MIDYLTHALTTLFVTIDPIGLAPIFLGLTPGWSRAARRAVAFRSCLVAFAILLVLSLVGNPLLSFLGISLAAFRVAGGLLLFWIAAEMVFAKRTERKANIAQSAAHEGAPDEDHDIAIFPLAIPLIAGPGAISAVILLSDQAPSTIAFGGMIASFALVLGGTLLIFLGAQRVDHVLGDTGRAVLTRLLGVILAALAVQFVADGVIALAKTA
ncbi:MarC family protein [Amorphus sp. 3PC139-8]|uniref:MarC family protein n=1 Tax=Amorphus sp. 3PC139-8 TaxID=2735676 RepID=UPI00345D30EF